MIIIALILGYLIGLLPSLELAQSLVNIFDEKAKSPRDRGFFYHIKENERRAYMITTLFDLTKGILAVMIGAVLGHRLTAAYGALLGHVAPAPIGFSRDRGLAIYLGSLLILLPKALPIIGLFWFAAYYFTRKMILSTILSFSLVAPVYMIMAPLPLAYAIFGILAGLTIGFCHHQKLMENL